MYNQEVLIVGGNELSIQIATRLAFANAVMVINDQSIDDTLQQLSDNHIPVGFERYHLCSENVYLRNVLHVTPDIVINTIYVDDTQKYDALITRFLFLPEKIMNAFRNLSIPIAHVLPLCQTTKVVKRKIDAIPFGVKCQPISIELDENFCLDTAVETILDRMHRLIHQIELSPQLLTQVPA